MTIVTLEDFIMAGYGTVMGDPIKEFVIPVTKHVAS